MVGYSGTPLARKLGIKEASKVAALGAPPQYRTLLAPLPKGVRLSSRLDASAQMVHVFSTRQTALAKTLARCRSVSWT